MSDQWFMRVPKLACRLTGHRWEKRRRGGFICTRCLGLRLAEPEAEAANSHPQAEK